MDVDKIMSNSPKSHLGVFHTSLRQDMLFNGDAMLYGLKLMQILVIPN